MSKIKIGTTFSATYADSRPTWKVIAQRGPEAWEAEVTPESLDYVGNRRVFGSEEIRANLRYAKMFADLSSDHERYYAGLNLGDIVHYHNAFGQYVRCEVVVGPKFDRYGEAVKHGRALKAIALVGAWREHDLPRRMDDGSIQYRHYPDMVVKGENFEPNFSNLYEAPGFFDRGNGDPRKMEPIDLSVRPMTPEEESAAELVRLIKQIGKLAAYDESKQVQLTPQQKLETIYMLVSSNKAKGFMRAEARV